MISNNHINLLSEHVRNLIAAGEVVERPSSVVKELVENSIDAGADEINIDIADGGAVRITVADNGCGMGVDDLRLSVEPHATSKIFSADDLTNIKTMGFRGEALASIAAVSRLTIESKIAGSAVVSGNRLRLENGTLVSVEEAGLADGTRVIVEDLFANVPARKKFMRQPKTEAGHIKDMIERLSLAHPDIRFRLTLDGRDVLTAFTIGDGVGRAGEVLGREVAEKSLLLDEDAGEIRLYGLVGDPSLARDGAGGLYWFVNRRPIKDRMLNHAISEAYRSLLPKGIGPVSVLYITMSPELVDVNVHPTKSEVRFAKPNAVHQFVLNAVRKRLGACHPEARAEGSPTHFVIPAKAGISDAPHVLEIPAFAGMTSFSLGMTIGTGHFSSMRPIGQFKTTYIICEATDGKLIIIDQHAVHERIGYERLKRSYSESKPRTQKLLLPEMVEIPSKCVGYLETALADLAKFGWEIEFFGGNSFSVTGMPSVLGNVSAKNVVQKIAEELSEFSGAAAHEEKIDALLKVTACHAQVRAGDKLGNHEISALLREMDEFEWSGLCPHGRSAVKEIELSEIEKWFGR